MQKLKNNEARPKFTGSYKKSVYVLRKRYWNFSFFSSFNSTFNNQNYLYIQTLFKAVFDYCCYNYKTSHSRISTIDGTNGGAGIGVGGGDGGAKMDI